MNRKERARIDEVLQKALKSIPTDYTYYGGTVERWKDDQDYPDCSCGCRHFIGLEEELGHDWGGVRQADWSSIWTSYV